ncbi:MAG: N-acetylmuramoyl-L-alanine amidase [Tepidisphaerales bacterium]
MHVATRRLTAAVGLLAVGFVASGCRRAQTPPAPPSAPPGSPPTTAPTAGPFEPAPLSAAMALLDNRPAWDDRPPLNLPRHPYERLLKNWVIVLDPGHGGDAHIPGYKKGPTGVREAEMNFRVAVLLKRLLEDAGAIVYLTRDDDYDLSLTERAEIANTAPRPDGGVGADLFISIHHNASDRPTANYTSVWFHGPVDRASVELDVARYLQNQLTWGLRTSVPPGQAIFNDRQMYAGGFGVLRAARVPAILTEASFFSNPDEEQRLRDGLYNLREAYAMYLALCEYARGGRPTQSLPVVQRLDGGARELSTTLDDGLGGGWGADLGRILETTIDVRVAGVRLPHRYDPRSRRLTVLLPTVAEGQTQVVELRFANHWKHHNHPQRFEVSADGTVTPLGPDRDPRPTTGPIHPDAPVGTTRPGGSVRPWATTRPGEPAAGPTTAPSDR